MADSTKESLSRGLNLNIGKRLTETCKSVDHFIGLTTKINDLFNKQIFCDITLISNDGELKIQAHKLLLCAASNYFLAMFGGSMQEANKKEITLKTIDGATLQLIISYIYTSSIELSTDTVEKVIIAADLLDLTSLKTLCGKFIAKQLDPSNCLGIALFAERYNIEELYKTAETFVCDNFTELRKDEEFFKLDVHQLCKFLSSSDIRVDSEEDVFRSMLSWVNHDRSTRLELVNKLLNHIRFPLLTPKFIATAIEPTCKDIKCEQLILKAYKWHLLPEFRQSLYTEKQSELRNFTGLIMAYSGWENNGGDLNVGLYYPVLNKWTYRSGFPALTFGRKMFGSTTFQGKLIIAGGIIITTGEMTDRVDCLDLKTFTWTSLSPLNVKRKDFKMATLNGCIYAVGGQGELSTWNTMEKYDPSNSKWTYVAPMNYTSPVIRAVSITQNKLCVSLTARTIHNRSGLVHHSLYDAGSDTWTDDWLASSDNVIGTAAVRVFNNDLFLAITNKDILRYTYLTQSKDTIPMSNGFVQGQCNDCQASGDRVIVFGKNVFQEYNAFANEWKQMPHFENNYEKVVLVTNLS